MIIGIGVDLLDVGRFQRVFDRFGKIFLQKIFCPQEQIYCDSQFNPILSYAKRFAAKEAISKALGLGIGRILSWKDMEICNHPSGSPFVVFSQISSHTLQNFWPGLKVHISLSDQPCYVQAFAVATRTIPFSG